jgi:isoquinoline 1-oxidoreductase beta subunit
MAGRIRKIARRSFLIGSVAVAGGVAFGVYKFRETPPNPLAPTDGAIPLNPFVVITRDGVTIITPKAEMGQGVQSTWAALAAEELDVDWEDITILHGPPAQAYFNSALFGEAVPGLAYKVGPTGAAIRDLAGGGAKLLNLQLTGGSTSTRDGYEKMRMAGATARETLKLVAARRLGVGLGELSTASGEVIARDGRRIPYADLAEEAAQIEPPEIELRDPSQWRYLGRTMPRLDMIPKVTGTARYAVDVRLPGMKFATVRMNPRRTGMFSYDASAALAMEGVEKVIDLGGGIAVVARNTWIAIQAAEAVDIVWEGPVYPETTEALNALALTAFDRSANSTPRDEGDVDKPQDGIEIAAEYEAPWLAHTTMEPMSSAALFSDGKLTLWSGTQAPILARDRTAEAIGIAPEDVELIVPYLGGGYGRRSVADFSILAARVAAAMPDVPVSVTWSREEDMRNDFYRPAAWGRFRGVVQDGQAVLLDGKIASTSLIGDSSPPADPDDWQMGDRELVAGAWDQPYGIPNYRVSGYTARTGMSVGYWRSVGASYNGFFFDTFIDELAFAAQRDPLQFRLEMARREHEPSAAAIEAVAEMSGWGKALPEGTALGIGFTYSFGAAVAQVVQVSQRDRGISIDKVWIAADVGRALDPGNLEAQLSGGAIFGLSAAVSGKITFRDGIAEQQNFWDNDALRMQSAPATEVRVLETAYRISGVGEVAVPPSAPALGNALFRLTGQRARRLPFGDTFNLLV